MRDNIAGMPECPLNLFGISKLAHRTGNKPSRLTGGRVRAGIY